MSRPRETILREIARENERLAEIDRARGETEARRESLRAEPAAASVVSPSFNQVEIGGDIGYARGEAPLGYSDCSQELTVEYDDEALRHFEQDV